ncbi:sjogrens syndrome scleroderma autoantigen 1 family [Pyrrhoderma noxium]|uniref:Sjogrens syndrome scleroderma autoantigen 1 family n=1 Tax=Pyrrhoderma noxium TaxID=2282107 RepID=A0A286UNE5_9AGAM|nr:sjogrens syndrome scleroderma autoantigen 1 family [Pyrrhoderma noxium]
MTAIDVSSKLGEYMLKGWVLTDDICPNKNCPVPLMRSPKNQVPQTFFCANCDGGPRSQSSSTPARSPPVVIQVPGQSSPSVHSSSASTISRSSTPPTDLSSNPESPDFALPVESAESIRRRQQSDEASSEIGKRLLRGWAMLADECPNEHCYGIPLVRPPLPGGKDPRKECVICNRIYVDEKDAAELERLIATKQIASSSRSPLNPTPISTSDISSPLRVQNNNNNATAMSSTGTPISEVDNKKEPRKETESKVISQSYSTVLELSSSSLEVALQTLTERLSVQSGHSSGIDPRAEYAMFPKQKPSWVKVNSYSFKACLRAGHKNDLAYPMSPDLVY